MRLLAHYGEQLAASVFAVLAALLALGGAPLAVRLPFGLVAVLVLPGYGLTALTFPRQRDLARVERLALSIGLSLAVIAFLALALDHSPWGLSLVAVVVGLTAWTLVVIALAAWRRSAIAPLQRYALLRPARWQDLDPSAQRAAQVLCGAAVLCAVSLAAVLAETAPPRTEFYMLGPDGRAQGYPRAATVGTPLDVTVGITNQERQTVTYRLEARDATDVAGGSEAAAAHEAALVGAAGPLRVAAGDTLQWPLRFTPGTAGKDRQIEILLYKDSGARGDAATPLRRLRLWIDVSP